MLSSILAEAKGEKAPIRKPTPKVKSALAPKRETVKATSTALPASSVPKRAVAKHPAPIANALPRRPPTPAQTTIVRDINRSALPVDVLVAKLVAPHPLAVKQAAAREEAARQAAAQQTSGPQRRRAPGRRQPAAPRIERQNAPRPQQRQVLDHPKTAAPKVERMPKRLSESSYENMSQHELLDEAQFRGLELDRDYKKYLVDVLVLNDEAYVELMEKLGRPIEAVEFARGEVKHYNQELRRKRAEAQAAAQQAEQEAHEKKRQEKRAKAEQLTFEKKEAEKKAEELKQAAQAQKQEQKRKRKNSHNTDSGYSSKSTSSPGTGESSDAASAKGKKRARSDEDDTEDNTPKQKLKSSQPSKAPRVIKPKRAPIALPRAMQARTNKTSSVNDKDVEMSDSDDPDDPVHTKPVKKMTKKTTRVNAPTTEPSQAGGRRTRSSGLVEESEDEDMEDADEDTEDESDDFIEDYTGSQPKHKSKVGAMARSGLFAGFR